MLTMSEFKRSDLRKRGKGFLPRGGKWPAATSRPGGQAIEAPAGQAERKVGVKRAPNPAPALWSKAERALQSALLLRDAGDLDGAANRAYYAVFAAARAALASVRASHAQSKGHSTIVRRFEKHLIAERGFDPALGRRFIGTLSHARWVADYDAAGMDNESVAEAVAGAERFLVAIAPFVKKAKA